MSVARKSTLLLIPSFLKKNLPQLLNHLQFLKKWEEGYQVVYAIRKKRKEHVVKRMAYAAFYRLLQKISNIPIPLDSGDFCLMDRVVVETLKSMPERNRFVLPAVDQHHRQ